VPGHQERKGASATELASQTNFALCGQGENDSLVSMPCVAAQRLELKFLTAEERLAAFKRAEPLIARYTKDLQQTQTEAEIAFNEKRVWTLLSTRVNFHQTSYRPYIIGSRKAEGAQGGGGQANERR
jgi:hypothetical protein